MASPSVVRDMGETLASVLQVALSGMVAPANVRIATPDIFHELKPTPQPTCTIFLYRVAVNPACAKRTGAAARKRQSTGRCCRSIYRI